MNEKNQTNPSNSKMPQQEKTPEKTHGKNLKLLIPIVLIILILLVLIISAFLISNRAECPETCDDSNKCTSDTCSEKTKFQCAHTEKTPCERNDICEAGEDETSTDCPKCDDADECTVDSYNYQEQKCENSAVIIPPTAGTENNKYVQYANYFAENLIDGNKKILKCFFEPKLLDEEISQFINLSKDFTDYKITIASSTASLGKIQYQILDPNFESHNIFIYMRQHGDHWYIGKIEDSEGILQIIEHPNPCYIKNPDPDGYLLKICNYLVANKETIYPNKAPNDYSIKQIKNTTYAVIGVPHDVIEVRLDCCGTGDLAYIDKNTKEVIEFSPGDK